MEVITKSARGTQKLGERLSADLKSGSILVLYGELGSGKTTFIQGLARGLGIKKRIISPTFIFIRPYTLTPKPCTLYHVDLYRIKKETEAHGLGLEELFADKSAIVVIEWADRIKEILPRERIDIYFNYLDENRRKIVIKGLSLQ